MKPKNENAPGGAGASSRDDMSASAGTSILSSSPASVNDLFSLAELQRQTGVQAKDLARQLSGRFPMFTRQIFCQCANPEKYGCLPHPDVLRLIRESFPGKAPPAPEKGLTQKDRILRHLRDYGSITSLEAMTEYGIMRLASRISELRKMGYEITSVPEYGRNRYAEPTCYVRYYLEEGQEHVQPLQHPGAAS